MAQVDLGCRCGYCISPVSAYVQFYYAFAADYTLLKQLDFSPWLVRGGFEVVNFGQDFVVVMGLALSSSIQPVASHHYSY